jgi:anti-sigma factor RsiW
VNAPHPDIEELSDLAEELLSPSRTAELEVHLDSCSDCTQLLAAVQAVPALLADVPPPPTPPEVAARLDSVLHTEAAHRTADADEDAGKDAGKDVDEDTRPSTPTPIADRRPTGTWAERHPRLRLVAAAAATVAVIGGGGALIGSQGLSGGGTADTTSAGSGEQEDRAVQEENATGGRAGPPPTREDAYSAELDATARRLEARQGTNGSQAGPPNLTAAAASVHGLRVGMAGS